MTRDHDFKRLVRARMGRTGESYMAARARLRPAEADPRRIRGRHGDTAAVARLTGVDEATVLGLGGGIGVAYFVFEYPGLTTFYLGGRINPYVLKTDPTATALARLGVPVTEHTTGSARTAERQLRAALEDGPALITVDVAGLAYRAVPEHRAGMAPQVVYVEPGEDGPLVWDLAPEPAPMTWAELAAARAGVRSAKHRLLVPGAGGPQPDLAAATADAVLETVGGLQDPPKRNFGVSGLAKWADLLGSPRDPKGWARLFADGPGLVGALVGIVEWVETAGTGGGFFRGLYADFLEQAGATEAAAGYRGLAARWTALARAALPDAVTVLAKARTLLEERRDLLERTGAPAAPRLAAIEAELRALTAAADLDPATRTAILAGLQERVRDLATEEAAAAATLPA